MHRRTPLTAVAERRAEALQHRRRGLSYREVADVMGISVGRAHQLVAEALEHVIVGEVEELRALESSRLDAAQEAIWPKVLKGNINAIDSFLRLSARRARLLGLDAPLAISMDLRAEYEAELNRLAGLLARPVEHPVLRIVESS